VLVIDENRQDFPCLCDLTRKIGFANHVDEFVPIPSADRMTQAGCESLRAQRVVVLECFGSHGECIEFQLGALARTSMRVEVWSHPAHKGQRTFPSTVRQVFLERPILLSVARRLWLSPPALLIINTATGPLVRNLLCLIRPLRLVIVGIFHDVEKLRSPTSRMIARMVGARLMLAAHLSQAAAALIRRPVAYAHFLSGHRPAEPEIGNTLITVPGAFIPQKKDAKALLDLACDPRLNPAVKFVLLGRFSRHEAASRWWQQCIDLGVGHRFVRFMEFIPQSQCDHYLHLSSAILPLIHPGCDHYSRFCAEKLSGAVNLALAKRLPLLIHVDLADNWHFGPAVLPYADVECLLTLVNRLSHPQEVTRQMKDIQKSQESNVSYQQALYLNACVDAVRNAKRERRKGSGEFSFSDGNPA
jgi:hypothetical protein